MFAAESQKAADKPEEYSNLYNLLAGWLENDLKLKKYTLTAESAMLDYDSTKISNGIEVSLSSGNAKFQKTSDGTKCTFTPSLSLSASKLNDASLTASAPLSIKSGYETKSDNGTFVDNASVTLSAGIITAKPLKRKISLLEAERAYIEAERAVKNRAVTAEKEFYENLEKLYRYALDVLEKKNDLYDDEVSLRVLTAQGYSRTSSPYRLKNLDVQSGKRDVHEAVRKLERETALFAVKCGVEYERVFQRNDESAQGESFEDDAFAAAVTFLPSKIPEVELLDVLEFRREDYASSENAEWNKVIGELKRRANYRMELSGYAGYTFNETTSNYDTVDGGLVFDWRGISATAGVSVPTGKKFLPFDPSSSSSSKSKNPVYMFSIALKPNVWRLASIDKKQDKIESQIYDIEIKSAADEYESDVLEKLTLKGDLKWAQKSYKEELDMYSKLADDMENWFAQGNATKSDLLDALNNRERARINVMSNLVEMIIYNSNVRLLFVAQDDQGKIDRRENSTSFRSGLTTPQAKSLRSSDLPK